MILYVDAGTLRNGQRGNQETRIAVTDARGHVLFEKLIGDYTVNEGEILAILAAIKNVAPEDVPTRVYSDSKTAVGWATKGWPLKAKKYHARTYGQQYSDRLALFIRAVNERLLFSQTHIQWIPREENRAGWYLEQRYRV